MKFLQRGFDSIHHHFTEGGKLKKFYPVYEGFRTIFFSPGVVTPAKGVQIRDGADLKRVMMTVIVAMVPCLIFGIWNVGHQHFIATGVAASWQEKIALGSVVVLPIVIVSYTAGLITEFVFCVYRNRPVEEGFLVTGLLIPLVLPPTIPLWQVAFATVFCIIIGKEVFGGTGMNLLNVALTARAFLYFAYPSQISGEVWTYLGDKVLVDGYSGATPLSYGAAAVAGGTQDLVADMSSHWFEGMYSLNSLITGILPGSIGETSVVMCGIGALILIFTGVGDWKIMLSVVFGAYLMAAAFFFMDLNSFMGLPPHYHLVIGGLAFGTVFMATDPVTAPGTRTGKWIYGGLIGMLSIMIRVVNPAYPEGVMLAILFMNVFAPLIDYFVLATYKKRRAKEFALQKQG